MRSTKPILYNGYQIKNNLSIKTRIDKLENVEIYELSDESYLYLFENLKINKNSNRANKYNIFELSLGSKQYTALILQDFSRSKLADIISDLTTLKGFDLVAGMKELKAQLQNDVIQPLLNPEKYEKFKVSIPNGILLYGPPGCGKTYIIERLAEEMDFNFIKVKHSDIACPYIHGGVGKIAELFSKAKASSPCLLFIDEIEGLLPNRSNLDSGQSYKQEEINEFLMHLNDASKNKILIIGATNIPELIDPAILRSGRFDKKICVPPPDFEARKHLFEFYLKDRPYDNIDFDILAGQTVGYACSDIDLILAEAARYAVNADLEYISQKILEKIIENTPSSISRMERI